MFVCMYGICVGKGVLKSQPYIFLVVWVSVSLSLCVDANCILLAVPVYSVISMAVLAQQFNYTIELSEWRYGAR